MEPAELVRHKMKSLPPAAQQEVLEFVEFLAARDQREDGDWSTFSLTAALSGLEGDRWPEYSEEDFTERWR